MQMMLCAMLGLAPMRRLSSLLLGAALALALASPALAVDGVLEITQASALAGSVTPGDLPGFPVTLVGPGSYRLTSDLATGGVAATGGSDQDDITLDLNGFTIDGGGGLSNGIQLGDGDNWEIRNGTVRGFVNGIQQQSISDGHRVIGVRVLDNSSSGIAIANGRGHLVKDCFALRNGGSGVVLGAESTVTGTTSIDNAGDGISTGFGSRVVGNVANDNVLDATSDGIQASGDSIVIGNTVDNNSGFGLSLGFGSGYAHNSINDNIAGTVSGGTEIDGNICDGNATCP